MDYEKAYKEALERAKKVHKYSSDIAEIKRMEDIFPELAESDDEKIRKAQLDYWRSVGGKEWHGVPVQEAIAWLEKQGAQQVVLDELEMTLSVSEEGYLRSNLEKLIKEFKNGTRRKTELVEVDGFWTDEDESKVEDIVYFLDTAKIHYASTKALDDCITWLSSLKQRMEEQQ